MNIKWKKPSGVELESNDSPETIKACEALGWEQIGQEAPQDDPPGPDETPDEAEDEEAPEDGPQGGDSQDSDAAE